jgi:hypothetical protein
MATKQAERPGEWPDNNPGTKPNATPPNPPHGNPDAVEHAMIGEAGGGKKEGGRDEGLVNPPTVSLNPTSEDQTAERQKSDYKVVDYANFKLNHFIHENGHMEFDYPFDELDLNQGMFIPIEPNGTTDQLMSKLYKQIDQYRKQNSEVERDENGDDVMEDVAINVKQRNDDGTVKLDGDVPRMTIKAGLRPKLIGPNFVVKAVVKGDALTDKEDGEEAEHDGALVVRLG